MSKHKPTFIESIAEKLHLIPNLHADMHDDLPPIVGPGKLSDYPPPDKWDDWTEYEATSGQRREKKNYMIIPTTCFNCEAGCGLLSYVDKKNARGAQVRRQSVIIPAAAGGTVRRAGDDKSDQ